MAAYIYSRVSTFEQYVTGNSIEAQCKAGLDYVAKHGLHLGTETNSGLPGVFVDGGKSAFKKKLVARPGGAKLLAALKPGDTVVATATHRLFRRMNDTVSTLERWIEQGIEVRFVDYPMLSTNTANGKAMLYIFAALAQMKSELISARVKEARRMRGDARKPREVQAPPVQIDVVKLGDSLGEIMQEAELLRLQEQSKSVGTLRGYVRVSTKDQTIAQQKLCIEKSMPADLQGRPLVWYEDEGESAFRKSLHKRASGSVMLRDLQPGDIIVAWRTDRMFRSILDMAKAIEKIHKAGAYILIVEGDLRTDTQMGYMLVSMISVMAEIESQDISRSTKHGNFIALATSEKMRRKRLPKMFKGSGNSWLQKHFMFDKFFSAEERLHMYYQIYLTSKHYRDRRTACRVISNQWLNRKGLPPVLGETGDLVGVYASRVRAMQRKEFSERRDLMLSDLSGFDQKSEVMYPLNVQTIAEMWPRIVRLLKAARRTKGRLVDKLATTSMIVAGGDSDAVSDMLNRMRS